MICSIQKPKGSRLEAIALGSVPIVLWSGGMSPYVIKSFQEGNIPNIICGSIGTVSMLGLSYIMYREKRK